jgi:CxC2 like cysteine cluster associated with KDZ transposases
VQLGHIQGVKCPFRQRGHKEFIVLEINGLHDIALDFCGCVGAPTHYMQLIEVGWWPATPLEPQTAATMCVLRHFHITNLQGQITPTDFYRSLEQISSGDGLLNLPVGDLNINPWVGGLLLNVFRIVSRNGCSW